MVRNRLEFINATEFRARYAVPLLGALVLTAAAMLRGAEYDEQYTLFLTAGTPHPTWPDAVFPAGAIAAVQAGHASLVGIMRDLRATDVHPPFYFLVVSIWRALVGPGLLAARMFSVACGVVSLSLVGTIARRCRMPPVVPMLITLGCYGFVYTSAIARGFAAAELLTLLGVVLLLDRRPLLAGLSLGAACCCNYLAVFVATAAVLATGAWVAILAAGPFLALDAWFFLAQHASRQEQFPPFAFLPSLLRLARYQTAALFGGLPLYLDGFARTGVETILALGASAVLIVIICARPWAAGPVMRLVIGTAVASPLGLLVLGFAFNNTPIELRYLSFGLPFVALSIAWAFRSYRPRFALPILFAVQCTAILGLLLSPRTMQPARAAAVAASRFAGVDIVLLPRGNDGVGVVGAFGIEAPARLPILLISSTDDVSRHVAPYHRVALMVLTQDRDSSASVAAYRAAFAAAKWRLVATGSGLEVYEPAGRASFF